MLSTRRADPAVSPRIRRVVIVAIVSAAVYWLLTTASSGRCDGPGTQVPDGNGGLLVSQECLQLTLSPSPLMVVAFAVILLVAVRRASVASIDRADARRTLDRAATAIALLAAAAVVISLAWFAVLAGSEWTPGTPFSYLLPFPFAALDVEITG
ncbi:hypothetical protein ITJ64_11845 [Herbiconiux sp. VKM Ac-1786]|uniref:hypothetical protein n=1 Tax=Herbiconiux sp. VKM Ac-1786 TaxID=2783824 RepID=UPI00188C9974|nr:hypothetical protein [Herbiconiux sp. VKM Ac-1786]MBF4573210.1 hypothetical protein [Herbiconiux sp. VKM Ac-1786]